MIRERQTNRIDRRSKTINFYFYLFIHFTKTLKNIDAEILMIEMLTKYD